MKENNNESSYRAAYQILRPPRKNTGNVIEMRSDGKKIYTKISTVFLGLF